MKMPIEQQIRTLSGSTMGHIFDVSRYDEIERIEADWIAWVQAQPTTYDRWQDAYTAYCMDRNLKVIE